MKWYVWDERTIQAYGLTALKPYYDITYPIYSFINHNKYVILVHLYAKIVAIERGILISLYFIFSHILNITWNDSLGRELFRS